MQEPSELKITQLDIEVYDWKTGAYVADFSHILSSGLRVTWKLNDVDEFDFGLDYEQFKLKCKEMGVPADQVLSPGIHDIRVRYNGKYIIGGYVAQIDINLNKESNNTLQVRCLGFLNLFKGRITNAQYSRKTYGQIARSLVVDSQQAQPINKTSVPGVNTNGWVFAYGLKNEGDGAVYRDDIKKAAFVATPIPNGWGSLAVKLNIAAGTKVDISWRQLIPPSYQNAKIIERSQVGISSDQVILREFARSDFDNTWHEYKITNYSMINDNGWLMIEGNDPSRKPIHVTDFRVTYSFDDDSLYNLRVPLGVDTASSAQLDNRQRAYELQDVKEGIVNLTKLENDNFDFSFTPDRQFNVFDKKGQDKSQDIHISYPFNLEGGTITRDISDMVNYSYTIGSGIGDERLEAITHDKESRKKYGTIVKTKTLNDVKLSTTLYQHSRGEVELGRMPTDIPSLTVGDGSINPTTIETGDIISVEMENDNYLDSITDKYRITGMSWNITNDMAETMTLTLKRASIPRKKPIYIRYIKDIINGSNVNSGNHWVQIQAIEMQDSKPINRAFKANVTSYPEGIHFPERITNGNLYTADYAYLDNTKVSVTVDLGKPYPIDYVKVWHYYGDGRRYYTDGVSAGLENKPAYEPLEYQLWSNYMYPEQARGRISGWVQLEDM